MGKKQDRPLTPEVLAAREARANAVKLKAANETIRLLDRFEETKGKPNQISARDTLVALVQCGGVTRDKLMNEHGFSAQRISATFTGTAAPMRSELRKEVFGRARRDALAIIAVHGPKADAAVA